FPTPAGRRIFTPGRAPGARNRPPPRGPGARLGPGGVPPDKEPARPRRGSPCPAPPPPAAASPTPAEPPADMPPGSPFGPGIVALVTYLHGCQMVGYARLAEMLEGLFGLKISEGAIANMLARAAEPFAACAQTIHETVRNSPVIASDETSARVKGKTHWQWTFVAAT